MIFNIGKKCCDTQLARILAQYDNFLLPSDPRYIFHAAMKENGQYFILTVGNSESEKPGTWVTPASKQEIAQWIEDHKEDIEREFII